MGLSGAGIAGLAGALWPGGTAAAAVDAPQEPDLVCSLIGNSMLILDDPAWQDRFVPSQG
jgi:hypothetical protein